MKEYVQKDNGFGNSNVVFNDPQRGYVKKVFDNKQKMMALSK